MTTVSVSLQQQADYRFEIRFGDDIPALIADEPAPLGKGEGPSPSQLLCASVGNCLSDSLLFALRKFKQAPEPLRCEVQAEVGRNPEGRLRILGMHATITLGVAASSLEHLDRALGAVRGVLHRHPKRASVHSGARDRHRRQRSHAARSDLSRTAVFSFTRIDSTAPA